MLRCGDTFLAGDEGSESLHLHIVATPPNIDGEVLLLSVTTRQRFSDTTVILKPGDHPFIRHDSVIAYNYARVRLVRELEVSIQSKRDLMRTPLKTEVLKLVQEGVLESDFTENGVKHFYKEVMR